MSACILPQNLLTFTAHKWCKITDSTGVRQPAKGSNVPSIRSAVGGDGRRKMRPGHWFGSLLCVPF